MDLRIAGIPGSNWKNIRVKRANGKGRVVTVSESQTSLKDYEGEIRQVFIKGAVK